MDVAAFARGFLSLIQAQNMGVSIQQGADFLQPVVDIERLLGANVRAGVFGDVAGMVSGANYTLTVPDGQCWIVRAGSMELICAAGTTYIGAGILLLPPENLSSLLVSRYETYAGAGADARHVLWEYPGLVLNPGTKLGMYAQTVTGGGLTSRLRLYVERLKV